MFHTHGCRQTFVRPSLSRWSIPFPGNMLIITDTTPLNLVPVNLATQDKTTTTTQLTFIPVDLSTKDILFGWQESLHSCLQVQVTVKLEPGVEGHVQELRVDAAVHPVAGFTQVTHCIVWKLGQSLDDQGALCNQHGRKLMSGGVTTHIFSSIKSICPDLSQISAQIITVIKRMMILTMTIAFYTRYPSVVSSMRFTKTPDDGSFLADQDCWEDWWSVLACSLVAVETDSWCAAPIAFWTDDGLEWGW